MASGLQGFRASGLQGDGRDIVLDSLRGFGYIVIVFAHVMLWVHRSGMNMGRGLVIHDYIYSFHMPLFFMIAGYSHGMKDRAVEGQKYSGWFRKFILDLYVPCLFFSLAYWSINYLVFSSLNPINFKPATLSELYVIPIRGFNQYWFLCTLFFVKAVHLAFEFRASNELLHASFWLLLFVASGLFGVNVPSSVGIYGLWFHLGFVLKRHEVITSVVHPSFTLGAVSFMAGAAFHFIPFFSGGSSFFTRTSASLLSASGLFIMFYSLRVAVKFLALCGTNCMVIYCLHNYVTSVFRLICKLTGLPSLLPHVVLFLVCFVLAVIVPLAVVWLYRNVKCLRWVEYVFYPGKLLR
ncbi:MAG: acyltransferase family protein [Synergistaceae bacterium]|nr:acyltransferase family protein [Synergistaceae bacterium]